MDGKYWAKVSKRGITEKKRDEIENPYLNAHLHINMNSHIYFHHIYHIHVVSHQYEFQENPSRGLGGVAIMNFFK